MVSLTHRSEEGYCCPRRVSNDGKFITDLRKGTAVPGVSTDGKFITDLRKDTAVLGESPLVNLSQTTLLLLESVCPGDARPELMDGVVRTCRDNEGCMGGYSCQNGHCCPARIFTGVCANGGNASMYDGKLVMCSLENPCNQSGYTCNRAGYCCPTRVYQDYCPNGGKPAYHDGRPQTCHANKPCNGGLYNCDGGYCCPQSVVFNGPCPDGGMAAQMDGRDKQCDSNVDCGRGSYRCTNNYCCPIPVRSGMCPFNGIPEMMETGEPRMCNTTSPCMLRSNQCEEGYCCPRRVSTDGVCPGDARPELMDGVVRSCLKTNRCGGGYSCQNGHCCPARVFTGVCANGGNASMYDGKLVMCSLENPCNQSGYTCNRAGYCCPTRVYQDYCPNGGKPAYHDGRPQTCHANKPCNGGLYNCDGGYCCPQSVVFNGPCPNGGMAAQMDGRDKQCDSNVDCGRGSYRCTNNYCCPIPVRSGMCPFDGIPEMMETGEPRMCNTTSPCMSRSHQCEEGYCCPRRVSTDDVRKGTAVPGESPLMVSLSHRCEEGYCCPRRVSTDGVCPGDARPELMDGVVRRCLKTNRCGGGYNCQNGHCCPARVFTDYCPNGGKPAYHDGRPQTCHANKPCNGGLYNCDGGYCCPQKVVFNGFCPYGGIAEKMDKKDRVCDSSVTNGGCGQTFNCTNTVCCPRIIQDHMSYCPFGGMVETKAGQPRTCIASLQDPQCQPKSHSCVEGYCCPKKVNLRGSCPGRVLPEMEGDVPKRCEETSTTNDCSSDSVCMNNICCPTPTVPPGQCPTLPTGAIGTCVEACSDDTGCSGIQKCCSNGCGHTCQTPVFPVKPGVCPTVSPTTAGTCVEACSNDTACPRNTKCCSNGCGHTCQNPEYKHSPCGKDRPLQAKNGTTLYCGKGGQTCPSESDCKIGAADEYAVCCPSVYYEEKQKCANYHGGYPMHMRNGTRYDCSNGKDCPYHGRCMTDENGTYAVCCGYVGDGDKPCNYFRGGEERKYQNGTSLFCGRGNHRVTCPSDTACTVHPGDGFAVCCPKNATKPGTCPASADVTTETNGDTCADVCTADTDCDGNMKCCSRGCGHSCQKPVMKRPKTVCQMKQAKDVMDLQTEGDVCAGVFITRCDRNGNYSRTQCQDNTGVCWCVSRNGTEISGTRRIGRPQCNKATRPGQCPVMVELGENDPTPMCTGPCVSDDNCTAGRRCCEKAGCGPSCLAVRTNPVPELCPSSVKPMCCDFLQCVDHVCPAHPKAKCRVNPCAGCRAEFYDKYSNKVNCTEGMTPCQLQKMRADIRKSNATRRERIKRYLDMIKQEQEENERQDRGTTRPEDTVPMIEETDKKDAVCRQPMEKGPCEAYIYRYYYNHTLGSCVQFKYGGCDGNKNNFEDEDTCNKTCQFYKGKNQSIDVPPFCVPKPKVGDCKALIPKYFYNTITEKCEMFYWGGCGQDHTNIFDTEDRCMKKCAPVDICQIRNCGPEYVCQPKGKGDADCIPKDQVSSGFQPYVPRCEKDGSYSPQQCSGDTCWCVNNMGRPDNNTISVGDANCTGSSTGGQRPMCPDQTRPMICANKCHNKTCGNRTDVQCLTNPCKGCQVKFVDQANNEVNCNVNPCDMKEPKMMTRPAGGCLNAARRWFFKKSTQKCEVFKYSKNCYGRDTYFKSLLDCQNKCQGSPCGETGVVKTCANKCASMTCKYHPHASCKVNPCNCEAHFFDPVSLEVVNCSKLITQCQKNRTKAFAMYNEMVAAGTADANVTLPQCKEDGRFSSQQCNETSSVCWCVNGAGQEVKGTRVRVSSSSLDVGCKDNNVTKAMVQLRFNSDYQRVRGKEAAFIIVVKVALGPVLANEVEKIQVSEGSIVVDMTVNGEADPTVVAAQIEENVVNGDLQVVFEGQTLTADPSSVQTELVFQAQTGYIPVEHEEDLDKATVVALIVIVVVLSAILIIIALVFLWKRKSQEKNEFSSLEKSQVQGHSNAAYDQVYEKQ
ncbi:Boophilin-H2 [Mizuhopecten yessoensis]|uniref:Boophilin-H2 n=1 Tax=Mizuhopecten yessoensis TaxID=6573 RepID=A0A210QLV6_MIZYE|nr:Boophilin-H2 [Mizuhopecten yessoensis]